ncbi:hypothetical protein RJ641_001575 [Dillenia turbinata]|uniref:RING-type domain-containing protein n=1 Tax=Dillenia turbinata TaxID=194707 RepID=A0AAN8ZBD3_9MAGN
MAVEARHLNLFHPQLITDRGFMIPSAGNAILCNTQMNSAANLIQAVPESLLPPLCHSNPNPNPIPAPKTSDSGLTYCVLPPSRKRTRDSVLSNNVSLSQFPSILDPEIAFQIEQHQADVDRLISHHNEKVRLEILGRKKQNSRLLMSAIEETFVRKMKEKDEELQKMGKLNWALQEKIKSLCVENQLWRDLAQSNEAAANSLRNNLEQVLAHVSEERVCGNNDDAAATVAEDAESCCGSSDFGNEVVAEEEGKRRRRLAGEGRGEERLRKMCKKCGVKESSVVVLPCRHLCVCTLCGSTVHTCPVCNSKLNASVHVNMSA